MPLKEISKNIKNDKNISTEKYTLKTYLQSASGLRKGSLIWLAGIEVGNVSQVNISPSKDANRAVEVIMRIEKKYQNAIRGDSEATLGSIGLLGDKYIDISRGSETHAILSENGEVPSSVDADIKRIIQNSNDLVANLGDLVDKINEITGKVNVGQGTLGRLINDPTMFKNLNEASGELQELVTAIKSGEGVVGVSFKMKGPPKDIKTTVNPIKTLTPRFIVRAVEKMKRQKKQETK